ncbi:endonuclease/exonuclease/phosphatase family protein [Novosphingobium sp. KCTC 2891]|nr:endonuclease/exonuclease/phosphatase family protein [Novosphingobium sp. KCTC 2891]
MLAVAVAILGTSIAGMAVAEADSINIAAPAALPLAGAFALGAAATATSLTVRLLGWATLLAATCWGAAIARPMWPAGTIAATTPMAKMRIASFNVYKDNARLPEAIAWVLDQHADAVVLIEANMHQRTEFSALLRTYPYAAACAENLHCSTVILTRRPPGHIWHHAQGDPENRKTLSAVTVLLDLGCIHLPLTAAHFSRPWPLGSQRGDLRHLGEVMRHMGRDGLLIGDFNSAPWTFAMRRIAASGHLRLASGPRPTWPSAAASLPPALPLDQFYAGSAVTIANVHTGPDLGSDHRPLVADIAVRCPL